MSLSVKKDYKFSKGDAQKDYPITIHFLLAKPFPFSSLMSGNGWRRLSSQSYHVQTEYFPFVCCWCQQSFMEIEALITHHEAHLILLQDQVHTYYSTTFFRPQIGGNLSRNPFHPLLPMAETTTTIRASESNSSVSLQAGQFSLPYHQPAAGSSTIVSQLPLLRGNNVTSRQHQRGIYKWPLNVTSRQHPVRPSRQMPRLGLIEGRPSRAVARVQREMLPPTVDEVLLLGQIRRPSSSVVTRPLISGFGHPGQVETDQQEENETLDLNLSL